jgi:hypothetical protein
MLQRVFKLPPHSAVFFVDLRVDAAGVPLDRDSVLPRLGAATNAPIFSYVDNYLGQGIVGGPLMSTAELGRRMAEAAVRILNGEVPGDLKIPPLALTVPQYDWRELQRWNIREDRLPAGSLIRFREPTVWQQYRSQIALIFALTLLQVALISGLLFERAVGACMPKFNRGNAQRNWLTSIVFPWLVNSPRQSRTNSTSRSALF